MLFQSSSDLAMSFLESMGAEIVIFCVTILLVFATRSASSRVSVKTAKGGQVQQGQASLFSSSSLAAGAAAAAERKVAGGRRPASPPPGLPGLGSLSASLSPVDALIDSILELRYDSSQRPLQLYAELRPLVGLAGVQADGSGGQGLKASASALGKRRQVATDMYAVLVQCAVRNAQCHLVDRLMDDMTRLGVVRTLPFYESAMKQLAGQKQYQLALATYDRMQADGLQPSPDTLSCLINFASEVGEFQRAVAYFRQLAATSKPSIRACMTTLRVYAKLGDFPASVSVLRSMEKQGVQWDSLSLNVVLATGIAAGQVGEASDLLVEAASASGRPKPACDIVSYNTVLKGHAQRGDHQAAGELVVRMKAVGLRPNAITFHTLMDAAVRSQQPSQAWSLLDEMRAEGFTPDKFTCSILVKAVAKEAKPEHISAMLSLLQMAGAGCDTALRSSLYHNVLDAASRCLAADDLLVKQVVLQMRQQQVCLNDAARKRIRDRIDFSLKA